MSKRDVAIALFEEGFNCAQAVSAAFCDEAGVSKEVGGQAVLGRQEIYSTPWPTERHGYDPT